jgi:hypothetical protein
LYSWRESDMYNKKDKIGRSLANLKGPSWWIWDTSGFIHELPNHYCWLIFVSDSGDTVTSCENSLYNIYSKDRRKGHWERERETTLVGSFVSQAVSHERMNNDNNGKETEGESPSPWYDSCSILDWLPSSQTIFLPLKST